MRTDAIEIQGLSRDDLLMIEELTGREINDLSKKVEELEAQLAERRAVLTKVRRLRLYGGAGQQPASDDLVDLITGVIGEHGEPMSRADIVSACVKTGGRELSVRSVKDCLRANKGKVFEMIGDRGGARWAVIK